MHLRRESVASTAWTEEVRRLSGSAAGRPCTLVVMGGVASTIGTLPLAHLDYDPRGRDLTRAFGSPGAGAPHLTHVVHDVSAIDRFVNSDGTDRMLRITGSAGDVLLRLA